MIDISINLDGLFGILIFFATVAVLSIVFVITAIIGFVATTSAKRAAKLYWSKYFLFSSVILLAFDGVCFLFWSVQKDKTIGSAGGKAFDSGMLLLWLPLHLVGFFVVAKALRVREMRKAEITKSSDKLR